MKNENKAISTTGETYVKSGKMKKLFAIQIEQDTEQVVDDSKNKMKNISTPWVDLKQFKIWTLVART